MLPKVYLRTLDALNDQDVKSYLAIANDTENQKYVYYLVTKKDSFTRSLFTDINSEKGSALLGIFDDSTDNLIGALQLVDNGYSGLEVAYFIGRNYRNYGFAKATIRELIRVYKDSSFKKLIFYVQSSNIKSQIVLDNFCKKRRYGPDEYVYIIDLNQ